MFYAGIADEAASDIDGQIKVIKELGWENIELRGIEGKNITDINEQKFDELSSKLNDANIKVCAFSSRVANWGKDPIKEDDFKQSLAELKRAIPRMKKLGTKMIRGMSFAVLKDRDPFDPDLEKEIFDKLEQILSICEEEDIIYLHENCKNHFSQSYKHMEKLLARFDSPYFKIVFDTGNSHLNKNKMGDKPYEMQTSWEAYQTLKSRIAHVHIKDSIFIRETDDIFPEADFTYPGEGNGDLRKIIKDLLENGYDGGFSIEPHMASVYHSQINDNDQKLAELKYDNFVNYGNKFMNLVREIKEKR